LTNRITTEERNNGIQHIKKILHELKDVLKLAENIYKDAVKKGNTRIQKEIEKQIVKIKSEEASVNNIIIGLEHVN
jgi:hypothetical protein